MVDRFLDLSGGFVTTSVTRDVLSLRDAQVAAREVYDEFCGDDPIQDHILELAAAMRPEIEGTHSIIPNLQKLRQFDYLKLENLQTCNLRTKGIVAINMVLPEIYDEQLAGELVEPFDDYTILPSLYEKWKLKPKIS